jgi:hypothetical protein
MLQRRSDQVHEDAGASLLLRYPLCQSNSTIRTPPDECMKKCKEVCKSKTG